MKLSRRNSSEGNQIVKATEKRMHLEKIAAKDEKADGAVAAKKGNQGIHKR